MAIRLSVVAAVVSVSSWVLAPRSRADWVVVNDGTRYQGIIVQDTEDVVSIDTIGDGFRVTLKFKRSEIKQVTREAIPEDFFLVAPTKSSEPSRTKSSSPNGESARNAPKTLYLEIPIVGTFGKDFDADGIAEILDFAKRRDIHHVLLYFDTDGGDVSTAREIGRHLSRYSDSIKYYALIKKAYSAALWMLVECDQIYFLDGATTGAAVVYSINPATGNAQVDAKLTGAFTAELCARAARKECISSIIIKAMIDQESEVYSTSLSGVVKLFDRPPPSDDEGIKLIDSKKTVLALSGSDAIRLGFGKPWRDRDIVSERDWKLFNRFGEIGMKRAKSRVAAFEEANTRAIQVKELLEVAQNTKHPSQYQDYQYEPVTRYGRDGLPYQDRRMSSASEALWQARHKVYESAWGGVVQECYAIETLIRTHQRGPLPDDLAKLRERCRSIAVDAKNRLSR